MKRFRIISEWYYAGCIPIIIYWVQMYEVHFWVGKWIYIKGFDTYERAKELLKLLQ